MPEPPWLRVERVHSCYDNAINEFTCHLPQADDWLHHNAHDPRVSVFLCLGQDASIAAFFALRMHTVARASLSVSANRNEHADELPAALICWVALAQCHQGEGHFRALLAESLRVCVLAADSVAFRYIVIDAFTEDLVTVYQKYGFTRLGQTRRLIMKVSAARRVVAEYDSFFRRHR